MCDYSIYVKSRPAAVGETLVTRSFGTGTIGFSAPDDVDKNGHAAEAVCVLPGTELAFEQPVKAYAHGRVGSYERTARFRQIRKDELRAHHDTLEFPDGTRILLTHLELGQRARVLQLPAAPKTKAERAEQTRAEYIG